MTIHAPSPPPLLLVLPLPPPHLPPPPPPLLLLLLLLLLSPLFCVKLYTSRISPSCLHRPYHPSYTYPYALDVLFRGIIEDYYFKGSNRRQMWNNTESRIFAGDPTPLPATLTNIYHHELALVSSDPPSCQSH